MRKCKRRRANRRLLLWFGGGVALAIVATGVAALALSFRTPRLPKFNEDPNAIEAAGARLLYLPPYSPDFNPLENMWSKIKQILRSQAPRTGSELLLATKAAFQALSAADCLGFFFNAQYATYFMEAV